MKKKILIFSLAFGFVACNDNTTTETNNSSDSANHSAHQSPAGTVHTTDTTGMAGKDMMTLMNHMMDQMKRIQSTGSPDNDFAALMKAHHLGAIEMAEWEVVKGTDPQIKQMAQKMIDDQQREVSELNTFLSGHGAHGGGDAFFKEAMASMNNMKMDMDHTGSVDRQFAQMMIPHHQSAVDMARAYLKSGGHEEKLKTMANNIISSQQKEINDLQSWLAKNK